MKKVFILFLLFSGLINGFPLSGQAIPTRRSAHAVTQRSIRTGSKSNTSLSSHTASTRAAKVNTTVGATISAPSSVCQWSSQNVTFTGSGGSQPYTFTYKMNNGTSASFNSLAGKDYGLVTINTNTPGTYTYKLVSVSDASNATEAVTDSVVVTVNPVPLADFSFTNNNSCAGSPIAFTPTLSGTYSYLWDFGDGQGSTDATPTHYYSASGTGNTNFNAKLTITNTVTGCTATSATKTITVTQGPDPSLNSTSTTVTIGSIKVFKECSSLNDLLFTFGNATATAGSNQSYEIDWGDGSPKYTATSWTSTTHNYSKGSWDLTYKITGNNGCVVSKKYIVFLGSNPAVTMGNPGNTDICINTPLTFPITSSPDNPPGTVYSVTFNDGSAPLVFDDAHPLPATVTHTFTKTSCGTTSVSGSKSYPNSFSAEVIASNPCSSSAVGVVPIYVSTPPQAKLTVAKTSVCLNTPACLTDGTTQSNEIQNNGVTATCSQTHKVIWQITPSTGYTLSSGNMGDDLGSSSSNMWVTGSTSICPTFTVPGSYTVKMKVANRCGIDEVDTVICVEPALVPQFTVSTTSGCIPLTVSTTNTTDLSKACTTTTYKWTVSYTAANCGTISGYTLTSGSLTSANPTFQFTNPGTYSLKLTTTNSCGSVTTTAQTISVSKPPVVTINAIANLCGAGSITPTATVTSCTSSTTPLTYAWTFTGGTPASSTDLVPGTISYTTPGTYNITLTATNDCGASVTATKSFTLSEIPVLTNTDLAQTICSGLTSTPVSLISSVTGGTFVWTATATAGVTGFAASGTNTIPAQTISTSGTTPGTVNYVITPKSGSCNGTPVNYVITVNPAPKITSQPVSSTVCKDGSPTALAVSLANTTGTVSYQWYSNTTNAIAGGTSIAGETNANYTPPTAAVGTMYYYCIISLSSGGCSTLTSSIASIVVNDMPVIKTQPIGTQSICAGGSTSPIAVVITGGAGISYQWYQNTSNTTTGGTKITSGGTSASYSPPTTLLAGTYYFYVEISFTGSGCGNSIVSNPSELIVVPDPVVDSQPLATQTLCQSATADSLKIKVSGGIGAFSYQWYKNATNSNTGGSSIGGATLNYYVPPTATVGTNYYYCIALQLGGPGCSVTSDVAAVIVKTASTISGQPASSIVCKDGAIGALNITLANSIGTPTYQWYVNSTNNNSGGTAISGANSASYSPPSSIIGTFYYYCVVTLPAGGCSVLTSNVAVIVINPIPVIANKADTICSNQTFSVSPANTAPDVAPIGTTYTWTAPSINPAGAITGASAQATAQTAISQKLVNKTINPATVTYTVIPKIGTCTGAAFKVVVLVNPAITANITKKNITCIGANNGELHATLSGGVPFAGVNPYQINWTSTNGFSSIQADNIDLKPGVYTLSVQDAGGCPFTRNDTIQEPTAMTIQTVVQKNAGCFGDSNGQLSITANGGTAPYKYNWTKNGAAFSTLQNITNLGAGNYVVTVTDFNNCSPQTANFTISESPALVVNLLSQKNNICFGDSLGAITVQVSGGTPIQLKPGVMGYLYSWKGPNNFKSTALNLNNIRSGSYTLTVTDNAGCTKDLTVIITEPSEIKINAATTPVTCYGANNASIVLTVSGGKAPYVVKWSNFGSGLVQDNLSPGDYVVTVTDASNCQNTARITIPNPPGFTMNPVVKHVSCYGAHDGSITLNLKSGSTPLTMVWTDNGVVGSTRNNIGPGTYTVKISDSTPCSITESFVITEPNPLVLTANITHAFDCNDTRTGAIGVKVAGGIPPYHFSWSNGSKTDSLSRLTAGNYLVTVTDSVGCSQTAKYTVTRPEVLSIKMDSLIDFNCTTKQLKIIFTAHITGGVRPYKLKWSRGTISGAEGETMETNQEGLIALDVTDARGCTTNYNFNAVVPQTGIDYTLNDCDNRIYQFNALAPDESNIFYTYAWNFGDGEISASKSPKHTFANVGSYPVQLDITGNGCTAHYNATIAVTQPPIITIFPEPKLCFNDSLVVRASGAHTYRWSNGTTADTLVLKHDGEYSVVGVSKAGCTTIYKFTANYYERFTPIIQSEKNEVSTELTPLHLWAETVPSAVYYWDFGDGTTDYGADVNHTFNVVKDGYFDVNLQVTNTHGCVEKTTKRIWIKASEVANSFSPNGDGKNDVFLKGWHIQVFNRNGILIYDGTEGWDGTHNGKPVSNDTYYYIQFYSTESGTKSIPGYVTIVR